MNAGEKLKVGIVLNVSPDFLKKLDKAAGDFCQSRSAITKISLIEFFQRHENE